MIKKNNILISISFVSNRIKEVEGMFNSIESTASNPKQIEVIVGIDDVDKKMKIFLDEEIKTRKFQIKYLIHKYEGFDSLWKYFNPMHNLCDKTAYFVQHSNDEMRFLTQDWDEKLKKYIGFFEDDIFRLRLSKFKLFNYANFLQALGQPENFAIHTKKWIDITGWCDCHSADLYQQMVSLYLARGCPEWQYNTIFNRDIPIFDIELSGLEAGVGENEQQQIERNDTCIRLWNIAMSKRVQKLMQYQANLLRARIIIDNEKNLFMKNNIDNLSVEVLKNNKIIHSFNTYVRKELSLSEIHDKMTLTLIDQILISFKKSKNQLINFIKINIPIPFEKEYKKTFGIKGIKKPNYFKGQKFGFLWPILKLMMIIRFIIRILISLASSKLTHN